TLANGSTVPGAVSMTGISAAITLAAVTGAAAAARPLPSPFWLTAWDVAAGSELVPVRGMTTNKYARPTPIVAPATYSPIRLAFISSTATPAPRQPVPPGPDSSGGPQARRHTRACGRRARGSP